MSSVYALLCLSHDPATRASDEIPLAECERLAREGMATHPRCDLLIARWSGGLMEIGCPARPMQPHGGWHAETEWIDADLLRVVTIARHDSGVAVPDRLGAALAKLDTFCWNSTRTQRLRKELEVIA